MRRLLLLATIMLIPSAGASAQALDPASSCWSLATKGEVVVTRTDGRRCMPDANCTAREMQNAKFKRQNGEFRAERPPSFAFSILHFALRRERQCVLRLAGKEGRGFALNPRCV